MRKGEAEPEAEEDLDAILQQFASNSVVASSSCNAQAPPHDRLYEVLRCEAEFFNPDNEMRRLFGRAVTNEVNRSKRGTGLLSPPLDFVIKGLCCADCVERCV